MSSYCSFWVFLLRVWMEIFRLPRVVRMNSPNICVLNMRHVNGTNSWITQSRKVDSRFIVTQEGHLSSFLYFSWNLVSFETIQGHSRSTSFNFNDWTRGRSGEPWLVLIWEWTIEIFSGPRNNQREYFKQLQIIEIKMLILSFWRVTSVVNEFWKRQNYILKTLKVPTNFSFGSDYAFLMFYSWSFIELRFF